MPRSKIFWTFLACSNTVLMSQYIDHLGPGLHSIVFLGGPVSLGWWWGGVVMTSSWLRMLVTSPPAARSPPPALHNWRGPGPDVTLCEVGGRWRPLQLASHTGRLTDQPRAPADQQCASPSLQQGDTPPPPTHSQPPREYTYSVYIF